MKRLPTEITVRPVIFGSLFGAKPLTLKIEKKGIKVSQGSNAFNINFDDIYDQVNHDKGMFFDDIALGPNGHELVSKWLRSQVAVDAFQLAINTYYQVIAKDILELSERIKHQLSNRYPRKTHWAKIVSECDHWRARFRNLPPVDVVTNKQFGAFRYIYEFANATHTALKDAQNAYVNLQLSKFKTYFDNIESNPLTEKQRISCIVDEENNLVLAGAGTGKTSVMIGRAGFLINSNQAQPREILMLAFARKAADEMSERIAQKLNNSEVIANTFHSLGQSIVTIVEKGKPSLSLYAEDEKAYFHFVSATFHELMNEDATYSEVVKNYFLAHLNEAIDPFDYKNPGDYIQAIIDNDIRTLKDEKVKGYQESVIANFLFQNGIEYIYEAKYEINTRSTDFRQYKPDFYLPEDGIYIEHYGIDENNKTAPYIDQAKYLEGMEWKRKTHEANSTVCIETFHHEFKKNNLLINLKQKLIDHGVELNPLPFKAILDTVEEKGQLTELTVLLGKMLKLYKASNLDEDSLARKATTAQNPERFKAATALLIPIYQQYQKHLSDNDDIDFDDMINKAIDYVRNGDFIPRWKYIMVDEFQDISASRAKLIKELRNKVDDCSVFCVGDDWQAIYRFTGSDLNFTTSFEKKFGTTKQTLLNKTFRFNNSISDIASRFVSKNPDQVKKNISTLARVTEPAVSLLRADNKTDEDRRDNIEKILTAISTLKDNSSVLILGRYNFSLPERRFINQLEAKLGNVSIKTMTVHASKGKEADFVVLLNLEAGKYGLPSEQITHPLLDALLPKDQAFSFSEERRLFYVAITRAKQRTYLISDMSNPSSFVKELINDNYPIEMDEFETSKDQLLYQQINCVICEIGSMVQRTGPYGQFYGCSHFPRCEHKENGCNCCGSLMKRSDRYKICTNKDCDGWTPVCPICGAEMVLRNGPYGEFWGCKNWRSQGVSCPHKENSIPPAFPTFSKQIF
ncbi:UvrD-helicase domain-containing protein [Pseudomonadota bacterium]